VLLHPDPVAEQRAAGERRARVDGEHRDPAADLAERAQQGAGDSGLAGPGRAGQADDPGTARIRQKVLDDRTDPR